MRGVLPEIIEDNSCQSEHEYCDRHRRCRQTSGRREEASILQFYVGLCQMLCFALER